MKRGSKYDPLRHHLLAQSLREFVMTFAEIEAVLGAVLPRSAERPQFWANTRQVRTHVQREAWLLAGYDAFLQSNRKSVKFRRVAR